MSWIKTIPPGDADGPLREIYDRLAAPGGQVDNILRAHSLRPHTLEGHMALYKAVLHHFANRLDRRLLESIGVHVSHLNRCGYCVGHHAAGLKRLLGDSERAARQVAALTGGDLDCAFGGRELAALRYAAKLTTSPGQVDRSDFEELRAAGFEDGEILEINQVTAYFAYANRTAMGLGVSSDGEKLGLSPSRAKNVNDWRHQ